MIDRYLLRYFLAVVDCGTFTQAAAQVNVSQPTLSVGIAKLERLLGARLFHRTSHRTELTESGSRLALHARRIETEFHLAESAMLGQVPLSPLRLGVLSTIPTDSLARFVRRLRTVRAGVRLELVEGNERTLLQHLGRGRIDAALTLVRPDTGRFAAQPLFCEGYALALAADHPLAGEAIVPAEAIADNVMIVRRHCEILSQISRHFTDRGIRPFLGLRTTNDDRALALVRAGLGVTVMPSAHCLDGVARPRLGGFDVQRTIGLLWPVNAEPAQRETILGLLRAEFSAGPAEMGAE